MTPWWTQEAIGFWGPPLFHGVFWPLTALGMFAARGPRKPAEVTPRARQWALASLAVGMTSGLILLAVGGIALAGGQPAHVWERLLLFGGVFAAVHGSILVSSICGARSSRSAGGAS